MVFVADNTAMDVQHHKGILTIESLSSNSFVLPVPSDQEETLRTQGQGLLAVTLVKINLVYSSQMETQDLLTNCRNQLSQIPNVFGFERTKVFKGARTKKPDY